MLYCRSSFPFVQASSAAFHVPFANISSRASNISYQSKFDLSLNTCVKSPLRTSHTRKCASDHHRHDLSSLTPVCYIIATLTYDYACVAQGSPARDLRSGTTRWGDKRSYRSRERTLALWTSVHTLSHVGFWAWESWWTNLVDGRRALRGC